MQWPYYENHPKEQSQPIYLFGYWFQTHSGPREQILFVSYAPKFWNCMCSIPGFQWKPIFSFKGPDVTANVSALTLGIPRTSVATLQWPHPKTSVATLQWPHHQNHAKQLNPPVLFCCCCFRTRSVDTRYLVLGTWYPALDTRYKVPGTW